MKRFMTRLLYLPVTLLATLMPLPAFALPEDSGQPIYIQSDRAERDERNGTMVYTGDVEIDQGSLHISAQVVTIESEKDEVSQIVATGSPAKMHQRPATDREPVYARANRIQYDVGGEVLTLLEDANVTREGMKVTGERIVYFVKEQRVNASSEGGTAPGKTRVNVVIPPRKNRPPAPSEPAAPAAENQGAASNGAP